MNREQPDLNKPGAITRLVADNEGNIKTVVVHPDGTETVLDEPGKLDLTRTLGVFREEARFRSVTDPVEHSEETPELPGPDLDTIKTETEKAKGGRE